MGRNAVREVLKSSPERVEAMFIATSGGDPEIDSLVAQAGCAVERMSSDALSSMLGSSSHQSYAARLSERPQRDLKEHIAALADKSRVRIVALDSIQDPQNLGAILRAAECFSVDAVIWSKNRGVSVTPVVAKTSVGASELVNIVQVSNLAEALRRLKDEGFWIVAADGSTGAQSISDFEFPDRAVLVFGSEGEGIQRMILENADFRVAIPMLGRIDSLNVSQAVAVFLYASAKTR